MTTEPAPNRPAPVVVVIGATGNQGGAVVDALLRAGNWTVRAFTRDPGGPAARALAKRGVAIAAGDMDDAGSLKAALSGAYGVFSVQNSRTAGRTGEVRQGRNVIDAAGAAGIQHIVYSSVGGVERVRGIPHFDSKWQIEQHLRTTGLTWTILRPTTFTSVFTMRGASIGLSMMAAALGRTRTLQMVAVPDIGIFARLALERPGQFAGQALEIAGDERTVAQIAQALRDAGHRIRYTHLPKPLLKILGPEAKMLFWFGESGYTADIPALRRIHPGLLTLDQWLRQPQT